MAVEIDNVFTEKIRDDEVCDATEDDSSTVAWYIISAGLFLLYFFIATQFAAINSR